jgi:hypothetical protein
MKDHILTLMTGTVGVATVEVTEAVATNIPTPEEVSSIGQLLIQIIIGIVTVWKLIKKPKNENKN